MGFLISNIFHILSQPTETRTESKQLKNTDMFDLIPLSEITKHKSTIHIQLDPVILGLKSTFYLNRDSEGTISTTLRIRRYNIVEKPTAPGGKILYDEGQDVDLKQFGNEVKIECAYEFEEDDIKGVTIQFGGYIKIKKRFCHTDINLRKKNIREIGKILGINDMTVSCVSFRLIGEIKIIESGIQTPVILTSLSEHFGLSRYRFPEDRSLS
ncbi:hypothetical protein CDIK_0320 [Cucumispora dikerogammari]|nr:hypothetical protein CDIK_0320 [Cucumispora dikerogammari]